MENISNNKKLWTKKGCTKQIGLYTEKPIGLQKCQFVHIAPIKKNNNELKFVN
jgi:hypothetical protein